MSRHRNVRNLDIAGLLEEDEYYEEEEPYLTSEQEVNEAQMKEAIDDVYAILGDDVYFPKEEIEETLWHYYFDVQKTIDYLLKKNARKNQAKAKNETSKNKKAQTKSKEQKKEPSQSKKTNTSKESKTKNEDIQMSQLEMDLAGMNLETKGVERPPSPPVISKKLNVVKEFKKKAIEKPNINLVIVGHVDSGKSTLMGHLLYQLGKVDERTMKKFERESEKIGKKSFAFAWVLDETADERERGITVDIATSEFASESKHFTILDAPGHQDFIPNMISGAAQADAAILVINSTQGEFETGFSRGGQTKEHALLIRSLGVKQVAIAINKLDTCDWDEARYNTICDKMKEFMQQAGFSNKNLTFVPLSGLKGDNLIKSISDKDHLLKKWYKGPTLLEILDKFEPPSRPIELPLRLPVSDFFKGGLGSSSGVTVSGRIVQGSLQLGDIVYALPGDEKGNIKVIEINDERAPWAVAGDSVSVTLGEIDILQFRSGTVLCHQSSLVPTSNYILAQILVFDISIPITNGYPVIIHHQSLNTSAYISKLVSLLDKSTGEVIKKNPRHLSKNTTAIVEIKVDRTLCVEKFSNCKELGRIALRKAGTTIATGIITEVLQPIL